MQSNLPPAENDTDPVAPPGNPVNERVTCAPNATVEGDAVSMIDVDTALTVKLAPVAVPPSWLPSPEYVAVTAYPPGNSVADAAQLTAGKVLVQSVVLPDVNVTAPVASAGRPDTESVSAVPYGTVAGAADSLKEVDARRTMNAAPTAVDPL
jgi:hypothetical protein